MVNVNGYYVWALVDQLKLSSIQIMMVKQVTGPLTCRIGQAAHLYAVSNIPSYGHCWFPCLTAFCISCIYIMYDYASS